MLAQPLVALDFNSQALLRLPSSLPFTSPHQDAPLTPSTAPQIKAVLCAALAPNVAAMSEESSPHSPPDWMAPVGALPTSASSQAGPGGQVQGGVQGGGPAAQVAVEQVWVHPTSLVNGLCTPQLTQPFLVFLEKVGRGSGAQGWGLLCKRAVGGTTVFDQQGWAAPTGRRLQQAPQDRAG